MTLDANLDTNLDGLETLIETAWDNRDALTPETKGDTRDAVTATLDALDKGVLRVAEPRAGDWHVNQWAKKAVLLSFRLNDMSVQTGAAQGGNWWDKVDSKFKNWGAERIPHGWISCGYGQYCAQIGVYRAWSGADAQLC